MKGCAQAYYRAIAILLLLFTGVILAVNLLTPSEDFSESENRMLQQLPKFSLSKLVTGKFASEFEAYLSDQFMLRNLWIGLKANVDRGMGKKESNGVYLGKDGYLLQKFTRPEKGDVQDKIKAIQAFDEASPKLRKYVMLVPTAVTVLADKLPRYAPGSDERAYSDEVRRALPGSIRWIDVYPALEANKEQPIYYKTDHHWTTKGAFIAYRELGRAMGFTPKNEEDFTIRQVTSGFYGSLYSKSGFRHVQPDSIELYEPREQERLTVENLDEKKSSHSMYDMGNLAKKDKYTVFFNGNHGLIRIKTSSQEKRRLLVVKDSYANSFLPFLTPHFSEIDVVDLRYYDGDVWKLAREQHMDEMLILYNISTFFEDPSIKKVGDSVE
ncbi:DHHW family protein [Brevibacillus reuszeri]|uniref:DHHW family protein n=1 Tax=Brevibacillus reuszeri TaxID=54915 RepID=UPI001EEC2BCE|nr:DHHW family protein [Brevibacillus reuszeri]